MTRSPPKVLVVEDEALLLYAIADELRSAGFEVLEASNADRAISILEAHEDVSVLFTDVDMPGSMDGVKLSRAVRDRWPPVKVVMTSGKFVATQEILPTVDGFVPKPYQPEVVKATIEKLL